MRLSQSLPAKTDAAANAKRRQRLRALMAHCNAAIETCFTLDKDEHETQVLFDGFNTGARLIKTSLKLSKLLDGERQERVQRIIVEHRGEMGRKRLARVAE